MTLLSLLLESDLHDSIQSKAMLPPFIIEQIRRREDDERRRIRDDEQRPRLEIPTPMTPKPRRTVEEGEEDDENRGVIILDLGG